MKTFEEWYRTVETKPTHSRIACKDAWNAAIASQSAPSQEPVVTEAMVEAGKHISNELIIASVCKKTDGVGGGATWQEYQNRGVPNFDLIESYVTDQIDSVTAIYLAMERAKC